MKFQYTPTFDVEPRKRQIQDAHHQVVCNQLSVIARQNILHPKDIWAIEPFL